MRTKATNNFIQFDMNDLNKENRKHFMKHCRHSEHSISVPIHYSVYVELDQNVCNEKRLNTKPFGGIALCAIDDCVLNTFIA